MNKTDRFSVEHGVTPAERGSAIGHRGGILWFTGLPGAGKSTLAIELERALIARRCPCYVLDGDNLRQGLSEDLGYAPEDRAENIRRVGEVAALFADAGILAVAAFVSPYRADRERMRGMHGARFSEIYINAPVDVCEARDPKGLYRRARAGEIAQFTGVSAPYEPPLAPDLEIRTDRCGVAECLEQLLRFVEQRYARAGGRETGV